MKLFEPVAIGKLWIRNRIVMPPMGTRLASEHGGVTEALKRYYATRAKGGVGLIIPGAAWLDTPNGKFAEVCLRCHEDRYIAGLSDLAQAVQAEGARIALQIGHTGRNGNGPDLVSASSVPHPFNGLMTRPLTVEGIGAVIQDFADAAGRAKQAGFDAVELHGAHGYLIDQFLSPYTNKRTDEYGGGLENRARFALELVAAVRARVGAAFPVIFRLSADEFVEGGLRLEQTQAIAQMLEKAGVDALHVSGAIYDSFPAMIQPAAGAPETPQRPPLVHLAAGIKAQVTIPVIAVGCIHDPLVAEQVLQEGKADLVSIGRQLIADPDLPRKAARGELADIRPCCRCNRCLHRIFQGQRMRCMVNPFAGRESEIQIERAPESKHVLVVGGGPGGLEAARLLALRGHRVSLYEKGQTLGGQIVVGSRPPHKAELLGFVRWQERQLRRLGVAVTVNTPVTPDLVRDLGPDAVVVANGASPLVPPFAVAGGARPIAAPALLATDNPAGETFVVVGGGSVGCETAEYLAARGKRVTIVEMLPGVATDVEALTKTLLLARLRAAGIEIFTNTTVREVTLEGVTVLDGKGQTQRIPADCVVLAIGSQSDRELWQQLSAERPEVYPIGDCKQPRMIMDAVAEAANVALRI